MSRASCSPTRAASPRRGRRRHVSTAWAPNRRSRESCGSLLPPHVLKDGLQCVASLYRDGDNTVVVDAVPQPRDGQLRADLQRAPTAEVPLHNRGWWHIGNRAGQLRYGTSKHAAPHYHHTHTCCLQALDRSQESLQALRLAQKVQHYGGTLANSTVRCSTAQVMMQGVATTDHVRSEMAHR